MAEIHHLPMETLFTRPLSRSRRLLDIALSGAGLVVLSPVFLVIALLVKLTSRGPVLFVQERTGQNLRRFRMYKFRTMVVNAHEQADVVKQLNEMTGPLTKITNDPRVTRLGRILRKASLDELPQLYNVFRGDMTIIGPRALSPKPSQYQRWQLRRFHTKPGIACLWQATNREGTDFEEWMRSDIRYLQQASWKTDIKIFLKTILRVLAQKGAR